MSTRQIQLLRDVYLRSLVIESDVYDAQLDTSDANDVLIAQDAQQRIDDYTAGWRTTAGQQCPLPRTQNKLRRDVHICAAT